MRSEAIKTRSSLYMLAAARDGINEMHPEILEKRMQVRHMPFLLRLVRCLHTRLFRTRAALSAFST
jgi:hypothetical protein